MSISCDVSSLIDANVLDASKISNLYGDLNKTNTTLSANSYFGSAVENIGDLGDAYVTIAVS